MTIYEIFVSCRAGHLSTLNYTKKDVNKHKYKICPKCGLSIKTLITDKMIIDKKITPKL